MGIGITILISVVFIIPLYFIWMGGNDREKEWRRRMLEKRKDQRPFSKEEFVKYFSDKMFDESIVSRLYDNVTECSLFKGKEFILHPDDELFADHFIDREDMEDVMEKYFYELNGRFSSNEEKKRFNPDGKRIIKFKDLLIFIYRKF